MEFKDIVKKEYVEGDRTLVFQTLSLWKLFILSVITGGFYTVIWSYNLWKALKNNFGYKVSPFWRAIFVVFTNFKLFGIISTYAKEFGEKAVSGVFFATLFFIMNMISSKIQFKTALIDGIDLTLEIAGLIILILLVSITIMFQRKINKVNEQQFPDAPKNPWSVANTIWTIIFVALTIIAYLPQ